MKIFNERVKTYKFDATRTFDFARFADGHDEDDEDDNPLDLTDERKVQGLIRWLLDKDEP